MVAEIMTGNGGAGLILRGVIPFGIFVFAGYLFIEGIVPSLKERIRGLLDVTIVAVALGMSIFTFGFVFLNAVFGIKLSQTNVWTFTIALLSVLLLIAFWRAVNREKIMQPDRSGRHFRFAFSDFKKGSTVFILLVCIFSLGMHLRLKNTLRHPGKLLDADPYRHHVRTVGIVETGMLSPWDPYIEGEIPVVEPQGCYVLAAVISIWSGIDPWHLWKFGSILLGSFSIITTYLLAKYLFGASTFVGLAASAFIAASPVHIIRTNIGFSEPWGLGYVPITILFFVFLMTDPRWKISTAFLFGLFFTSIFIHNPIPAAFLVPLFGLYAIYILVKRRGERVKVIGCVFVAAVIFFLFIVLWANTYMGVSMANGLFATETEGSGGLQRGLERLDTWGQAVKNVGRIQIGLSLVGLGVLFIKLKDNGEDLQEGRAGRRHKDKGRRAGTAGGLWKRLENPFDELRVFVLLFYVVYIVYILVLPLGVPSFTQKFYRYFLLPAFACSILSGYFIYRVYRPLARRTARVKDEVLRKLGSVALIVIISLGLGILISKSKTWGNWPPSATVGEYRAADWINGYASKDAIIICNWFTGDFIRSLTRRRTCISNYFRPEVRATVKRAKGLNTVLLKNTREIIEFAESREQEVYLLKSKWGPSGNFDRNPFFAKVMSGGSGADEATLYRVGAEGGIDNLAFRAEPIAGAFGSGVEIRNLDRLNDLSLGNNTDADAAATNPPARSPQKAWFGVDFGEEQEISRIAFYPAFYLNPEQIKKSKLIYLAYHYELQYWQEDGWKDIGGTEVRDNSQARVSHEFGPIKTSRVRVLIYGAYSDKGLETEGVFRTACLELEVYK
ncbi:MAG: hypothetical protein ACYTE5_08350 [Planctomycetota bacterium]|jgi:hypothetical protein